MRASERERTGAFFSVQTSIGACIIHIHWCVGRQDIQVKTGQNPRLDPVEHRPFWAKLRADALSYCTAIDALDPAKQLLLAPWRSWRKGTLDDLWRNTVAAVRCC